MESYYSEKEGVMNTTVEEKKTNWIGIDVSKDKLDVYDLSAETYTPYTNDTAGIEALAQKLLNRPHVAIVCEATGGYEATMALRLHQLGFTCECRQSASGTRLSAGTEQAC